MLVRIEQHEKRIVVFGITAHAHEAIAGVTAKERRERAPGGIVPVGIDHFTPARIDPADIFEAARRHGRSFEVVRAPKERVLASQLDELAHEVDQLGIFLDIGPRKPADFVVLTVGVVVAELRVVDLISREQHR